MKGLIAVTLTAAVVLATAGAAVAVAVHNSGPESDPVLATFAFSAAQEKQRFCQGADGPYIEILAHHEGTSAGDSRLTGTIELEAHNLINLVTGLGTSEGRIDIRDPATNRLKATGKYYGVFTEGAKFHGFTVARVKDEGSGASEEFVGDGRLYAFFKSDVNLATGTVTGQLGGSSGDIRTPAVIHSGKCSGPYVRVR
jgi:hypothetical protein